MPSLGLFGTPTLSSESSLLLVPPASCRSFGCTVFTPGSVLVFDILPVAFAPHTPGRPSSHLASCALLCRSPLTVQDTGDISQPLTSRVLLPCFSVFCVHSPGHGRVPQQRGRAAGARGAARRRHRLVPQGPVRCCRPLLCCLLHLSSLVGCLALALHL